MYKSKTLNMLVKSIRKNYKFPVLNSREQVSWMSVGSSYQNWLKRRYGIDCIPNFNEWVFSYWKYESLGDWKHFSLNVKMSFLTSSKYSLRYLQTLIIRVLICLWWNVIWWPSSNANRLGDLLSMRIIYKDLLWIVFISWHIF